MYVRTIHAYAYKRAYANDFVRRGVVHLKADELG